MAALQILLLEKDPLIGWHIRWEVAGAGHALLLARGPEEARQLYLQHLPDCVILNFRNLPEADGYQLAADLHAHFPARTLLLTGARRQELYAAPHFHAGYDVLYKPFSRAQLQRALRRLFRPDPQAADPGDFLP